MENTAQTTTKRSFREEFLESYLIELDTRMQRSQTIGSTVYKGDKAALFYDRQDDKFTLLVQMADSEEAMLFDCRPRDQWGRKAMVFGHNTETGGYIASGHGILNRKMMEIKLTSGKFFKFEVDIEPPYIAQFIAQEVQNKPKDQTNAAKQGRRGKFSTSVDKSQPRPNNRQPSVVRHLNPNRQFNEPQVFDENDENDFSEEDLARLRGEIPIKEKRRY